VVAGGRERASSSATRARRTRRNPRCTPWAPRGGEEDDREGMEGEGMTRMWLERRRRGEGRGGGAPSAGVEEGGSVGRGKAREKEERGECGCVEVGVGGGREGMR
jgi:hypothetical protein